MQYFTAALARPADERTDKSVPCLLHLLEIVFLSWQAVRVSSARFGMVVSSSRIISDLAAPTVAKPYVADNWHFATVNCS